MPTCSPALRASCSKYCHASCPTCSRASCPTCSCNLLALRAFMPHVRHVLRALVPHVPCSLRALVPCMLSCLTCLAPYVSFALRALHLTCLVPNMLSCLTCLTCCCTSRVFCLACSQTARASNYFCSCAPRPSLASGALLHLMSCSFHVLCLLYFCCFSYLSFSQSRLRLIIVIDSNKDTIYINNIITLYYIILYYE